jgi:hypothetical protein
MWRQLQLFDLTPIRDPAYQSSAPLYSDASLLAACATRDFMVLAVEWTRLKVVSRQFALVASFMAYDPHYRIEYVRAVPQSNLLVTVAAAGGAPAELKVWDLARMAGGGDSGGGGSGGGDSDDRRHDYVSACKIANGTNQYPMTDLDFNPAVTCVVCGYANGAVVVVRGDLLRDRGAKQRVVYELTEPVTGVRLAARDELAYVTTTLRVFTVLTGGRNHARMARLLLKTTGVALHCVAVEPPAADGGGGADAELLVATADSLRFYSPTHKTATVDLEIPKRRIHRFGPHYLLVVSLQPDPATRVVVADLRNKHLAFSAAVHGPIDHVFDMWGDVYMLSDGVLLRVREKPVTLQIEIVLQRHLYAVALALCRQHRLGAAAELHIKRLHGEHLYLAQDFDGAADCFVECLDVWAAAAPAASDAAAGGADDAGGADAAGGAEAAATFTIEVITKFKDASNIHNLAKFLRRLHQLGLADNDHLTLLLCCFCKLQQPAELDRFIGALDGARSEELNFPLIINLFKESGYYSQVIALLYKLNQPKHIVEIQLSHLAQPHKCLEYIRTLPIDDLLLILIDYTKTLLDHSPIDTTELLIAVFTGQYVPREDTAPEVAAEAAPEVVAHSALAFPIDSYKSFLAYISGDTANGHAPAPAPTYLPPRPSLIFPSFIHHPHEFVVFLEACLETFDKYQGNEADKRDLIMTLYELYLLLARLLDASAAASWTDKAGALLSTYATVVDRSSLLLVSHLYDFDQGKVAAQEQSGGFEESLFRLAAMASDVEACFTLAQKYADTKPDLWRLLLKFIVSSQRVFDAVSESDFKSVLDRIASLKLASPLEVVQILSTTECATVGHIKDYLIGHIDTQNKEISNNHKLIKSYESESTRLGYQLNELTTKPFVVDNNKCAACKLKLEYPVVHFKCKHSYHQSCLDETTVVALNATKQHNDCPLCVGKLEAIRDTRQHQFATKDNVRLFEQALKDKDDRFKVVTDYLGRGVMEDELTVIIQTD